jgi:hypothetical protein
MVLLLLLDASYGYVEIRLHTGVNRFIARDFRHAYHVSEMSSTWRKRQTAGLEKQNADPPRKRWEGSESFGDGEDNID